MQIASLRPLVGGTSVIALHVVEDVPKQLWPLIWLYTQRGGGTKQFFEMVFQFVYVPLARISVDTVCLPGSGSGSGSARHLARLTQQEP